MSVKVMGAIWDHYPAGGGERLTALALADHANHAGGDIYPSIARLAAMTAQSERAVRYHLRAMEKRGWLIMEEAGGGRANPTRYRIPMELIPQDLVGPLQSLQGLSETRQSATETMQNSTGNGANSDRKGGKAFAPEPYLTKEQPSRTLVLGGKAARDTYTETFKKAMEAYPKRLGNNPVRDAWKAWGARMREGVPELTLAAGVARYGAFCTSTGKVGTEYVLRASTFFGPARPFEQGFPVGADQVKPARVERRCIELVEGHGVASRCMQDGDVGVGVIEVGGIKIALQMCAGHYKPAERIEGRTVQAKEVIHAVARFKRYADKHLVPA